MTWKVWTILGCLSVLVSGCGKLTVNSYCDIASPHYFKSEATINALMKIDRDLLVDTVVHNETYERLCK